MQGEGEECPAWQGANFEGAFSEQEQNTQQAHRQQRAALSFLPSLPPPPNPRGFLVPGCSVLLESGKPTSPHPGSGRIREVLQNFLHEDLNRCQRPTLTRNDSRDILEQNNLKKKTKKTHKTRSHLEVTETKGHTGLLSSSLLGFSVSLLDHSSPTLQSSQLIGADRPVRADVFTGWGGGDMGALSPGT